MPEITRPESVEQERAGRNALMAAHLLSMWRTLQTARDRQSIAEHDSPPDNVAADAYRHLAEHLEKAIDADLARFSARLDAEAR